MDRHVKRNLIIVQLITLSRSIAVLMFISITFIPKYNIAATLLFIYACFTDVIDGILARKLQCNTITGGVLDLFSDKYLTIISMVYAIARDLPVLPCSIVILREVFLLSMRTILLNGVAIFPPQRLLGTITVVPIWCGTIILLLYPDCIRFQWTYFLSFYWGIGILALVNLIIKIKRNWSLIIQSFQNEFK